MRTIKMLAVAFVLALTGAFYAAGAMQDNAKTKEPAKAARSCCQRHDGTQTTAHAGMKHEGCGAGCCCSGGACSKEHTGGHARTATPQTAAAGEEKAGCCGGSCCKEHKAAAADSGESCCKGKDGAACCKGGGEACCKAHKPDAKQVAQKSSVEKNEGGGSCACCGVKAGKSTHAGQR